MASVHHENARAIPHQDARTATVTRQTILAQKSLSRAAIPHKDARAATVARQTILAQNSLRHRILLRRHPVDSNNNASRCRALRRLDEREDTEANDGVTPMEVDSEGYMQDLTAYRVPQAPVSNASPHRSADAPEEKAGNTPPPTRAARSLAAFMTPQAPRTGFGGVSNAAVAGGGGGGAPVPQFARDKRVCAHAGRGGAPPLSDAEQRAISERRRSALSAPDDFFKRAISGMSPAKKGTRSDLRRVNEDAERAGEGGGSAADAGESLRETVEGLKRRRESVLADAGRNVLLTETDADEGRVEFQRPTFAAKESEVEQETEKEKEKPRASMLRGRAKEESTSQSRSQPVESEPETKSKTMARAQRKRKEPQEGTEVDATVCTSHMQNYVHAGAGGERRRYGDGTRTEESDKELTLAVPAAPRRKRTATPTPASAAEEEQAPSETTADPDPPPPKPPSIPSAPTKPRRTCKATAEPESEAEPVPVVPAQRTARKPPSTDTLAPTPAANPATEPAKRHGRTAAKTAPVSTPERKTTRGRSLEIVAVVSPKRRARSVKPKPVKEEEAEPVLEGRGQRRLRLALRFLRAEAACDPKGCGACIGGGSGARREGERTGGRKQRTSSEGARLEDPKSEGGGGRGGCGTEENEDAHKDVSAKAWRRYLGS
ncbi:hypothetical protein K438DRAFT_1985140 [Mycena galopus ATCC 62051]|nr:hypothetical protein K438DRAFT_1985140 [Mycena galopus ATCC 62051]